MKLKITKRLNITLSEKNAIRKIIYALGQACPTKPTRYLPHYHITINFNSNEVILYINFDK